MNRIGAIDALRGITILAMILCAAINWGSGLPAWMFHCQTPPPDFAFHPEVRGLTWVDMVFPFFIFSMGAAIPVAMRRKMEKGNTSLFLLLGAAKRWLVLVLFSLVLGAADAASGADAPAWVAPVFRAAVWLALFAALVRTQRKWVNYGGWILIASLMALEWLFLGIKPSLERNDCIIMLLAHASLMGSVAWMLTRRSLSLKFLAWAMVIAAKAVGFDFTQYLVIVIPAFIAGDILLDTKVKCESGWRSSLAAVLAFVVVAAQLWGLFVRDVSADFTITAVLLWAFGLLCGKDRSAFARIGFIGAASLILGIVLDPACGGIAKDYCNLSYLFVTGGQAALTLCVLLRIEHSLPLSRTLCMTGQNPMIAYTIAWFVICPLLTVVGLMDRMNVVFAASPWLGFLQGVIITALVAASTSLFTHFKLYLRS